MIAGLHTHRGPRGLALRRVLFTRGTAIDGYLDGLDVARAVPPRDAVAVAAAALELWRGADAFRRNIADAAPRLFATFDPETNLARYRADVRAAVDQA